MEPFVYEALPQRVVFGSGTLDAVGDEVRRLGCTRALVLSTPQQADSARDLAARLGALAAGVFTNATMHTPVDVTETAVEAVRAAGADCVVALGGGSTTGLGKAIALRTDLPQVVVPTTYAGSEATPILGQTEGGLKTTQRSLKVLPEVIVYDVDLTMTLPAAMSATSGMNAIAHAVEALYAREANPIISMFAEEGIRAFARALPVLVNDPANREARSDALYAAWLCGICFGSVGGALHHKLCHVLGGTFDLPHAETHTVILPHATAYNAEAAPEAMARIARALGSDDAAGGLYDLEVRLGTPLSLAEIGMPENGLQKAADIAVANPYWNPRAIDKAAIQALLDDAYHGRRPAG